MILCLSNRSKNDQITNISLRKCKPLAKYLHPNYDIEDKQNDIVQDTKAVSLGKTVFNNLMMRNLQTMLGE